MNYSFSDGTEDGVLQKFNVALIPKEQCRAFYNGIGGPIIEQLKYGVFDAKMFCAGNPGRDECLVIISYTYCLISTWEYEIRFIRYPIYESFAIFKYDG